MWFVASPEARTARLREPTRTSSKRASTPRSIFYAQNFLQLPDRAGLFLYDGWSHRNQRPERLRFFNNIIDLPAGVRAARGRPPSHVVREYTSFHYRAKSWSKARRVVGKVEFHPGELFPRVGFIVTNRSLPNERVLAFCNQRGTAEQHIKEGKYALKWTRLSCMRFTANAVRLQLHALAYNLANFLRTLAMPGAIETWSVTLLRERLIKTGTRLVRHARYAIFQIAETTLPRSVFAGILGLINGLRGPPATAVPA